MAASATLALKAGVWFRRGRLLIVSPDSLGTACPLSGRNSTYRPVQISAAGSVIVTYGGAVTTLKQATPLIPIVFAVANDPIGSGLVASLSRPGGNVTGLSLEVTELAG